MICRLCGAPSEPQFKATVMDKYVAEYSHCGTCDYLQIDDPVWLEEAYRDPIGVKDTGYVMRNQFCAVLTASLLHDHFDETGQFADYGGGYGMFVQMMISMAIVSNGAINIVPICSQRAQNGTARVPSS